ncbi:MAG: hypothetical protein ACO1RX_04740 [Candidatus Sericytochromatia bacterium]
MSTAYWSPDSKRVAFVYSNDASPGVYVVVYDLEAKKHQIVYVQEARLNIYGWTTNNAILIGQENTDGRYYDELSLEGSRKNLFIRTRDVTGSHRAVPLANTKYVLFAENKPGSNASFALVNVETKVGSPVFLHFRENSISEKCGVLSVTQLTYSPIDEMQVKKIDENWFVYFSNKNSNQLSYDGVKCNFYEKLDIEKNNLNEVFLFNEEEIVELRKYRFFMGWLPNQEFIYAYDYYQLKRQIYEKFNFSEQKSEQIKLPSVGVLSPDGRTILYQRLGSQLDFFAVDSGEKHSSPEFFEFLPKGKAQYAS